MMRRIIILDIALIVVLITGGLKLRREWAAFSPAHQVSAVQPPPESVPALPATWARAGSAAADWTDIPAHNPFSFDRNDIAILKPPEPPKPVGPKPILFGTMGLGQGWIAMLASGQPNNRNSRPMHVGETLDGWTVVEITDKAVVVEANARRETVVMNDPTAQVPRDYTRTLASAAPPVQSVSPAPSSSAAPVSRPAPSAASPSGGNSPSATPCVRELRTPFGIVRQPCDDAAR
jgi:hypothetical protein